MPKDLDIQDAVNRGTLTDAQGVFFSRELEAVRTKSYDVKYADLTFRTVFPITHETPAGSGSVTIQTYDGTAQAKIINGYANDLPRAEITGTELILPVHQIGNMYAYTTKEIRTSNLVQKSLDTRRSALTFRGHEEKNNQIAYAGDADTGLLGLFNYPGIPVANVAGADATARLWSTKIATPDLIIADLNQAIASMRSVTKMKEMPNAILMPVEQFNLISSTPRSANSDTTILQYFLNNNSAGIKSVTPINEIEGAGTAGVDVFVLYRKDPAVIVYDIPMEFTQHEVQRVGLEFQIPCESEAAGLIVYYPLSLAIWEGI